jgi:hypothetical protein
MAALAAGVATSMAQNVYSLNIVGYANVQCDAGFHAYSNPFQVGVSNGANEIFDNSGGVWNDSQIQEWTGAGYNVTAFSQDTTVTTTGFANAAGSVQKPVPILGMGGAPDPGSIAGAAKGWLFKNAGPSNNIVFVGTVRTGTNSAVLPTGPIKAVGSAIPYAGPITSLGFTNTGGVLNDVQVLEFVSATPTGGAAVGYNVTVWSTDTTVTTTGFANAAGSVQKPEPQIRIGEGWLMKNPSAPITWTQILNP